MEDGLEEQQRAWAARVWQRVAQGVDTVPTSAVTELLSKLGLPVHLVSLPSFSTDMDFEGFVTLVASLRAAVEEDPERAQLEGWFEEHKRCVDEDAGVDLDLVARVPGVLGYQPLRASELDAFLSAFPTVGGLVSRENLMAGFLRARQMLHRKTGDTAAASNKAADDGNNDEDEDEDDGKEGMDHSMRATKHSHVAAMEATLRAQIESAEHAANAMREELDTLRQEGIAATKKIRLIEVRLADRDDELSDLQKRHSTVSGEFEALQREQVTLRRELSTALDTVSQLRRDAEIVANEAREARAKVEAAASRTDAERARNEDASAALSKAEEDLFELMEEKGRMAALVEKLIQTNRRLEETSREDQQELQVARAHEAQLRQELDAAIAAQSGGGGDGSLAQELMAVQAQPSSEIPSSEEISKLNAMVAHYSSEYVKASDTALQLQSQLEKAFALLDEKRRANQLLTDSSLELTAQLRAIERDRLGLVSQLKDRKRQVAMLRETVDTYAQQSYAFDTEAEDATPPSSVSAAVKMTRRRMGWWAAIFSCCRPRPQGEETRYTRLL